MAEKFRFWKPVDFINDYKLHTYRAHLGTDPTYEFVVPAKMVRIINKREWNYSHDPPLETEDQATISQCPWLNVDNGGKRMIRKCVIISHVWSAITDAGKRS